MNAVFMAANTTVLTVHGLRSHFDFQFLVFKKYFL